MSMVVTINNQLSEKPVWEEELEPIPTLDMKNVHSQGKKFDQNDL